MRKQKTEKISVRWKCETKNHQWNCVYDDTLYIIYWTSVHVFQSIASVFFLFRSTMINKFNFRYYLNCFSKHMNMHTYKYKCYQNVHETCGFVFTKEMVLRISDAIVIYLYILYIELKRLHSTLKLLKISLSIFIFSCDFLLLFRSCQMMCGFVYANLFRIVSVHDFFFDVTF